MKRYINARAIVKSILYISVEVLLITLAAFGLALSTIFLIICLISFCHGNSGEVSSIASLSVGLAASAVSLIVLIRNISAARAQRVKSSLQCHDDFFNDKDSFTRDFTLVFLQEMWQNYPQVLVCGNDIIEASLKNEPVSPSTYFDACKNVFLSCIPLASEHFSPVEINLSVKALSGSPLTPAEGRILSHMLIKCDGFVSDTFNYFEGIVSKYENHVLDSAITQDVLQAVIQAYRLSVFTCTMPMVLESTLFLKNSLQ